MEKDAQIKNVTDMSSVSLSTLLRSIMDGNSIILRDTNAEAKGHCLNILNNER